MSVPTPPVTRGGTCTRVQAEVHFALPALPGHLYGISLRVVSFTDTGRYPFSHRWRSKAGPVKETRRCHVCNEVGHLAPGHKKAGFKKKIKDGSGEYRRNESASMGQMLMAVGNQDRESKILLHAGASDHMVGHAEWLHGAVSIKSRPISLGNDKTVHATKQGQLVLISKIGTSGNEYFREVTLHEVLYVLGMASNLISCGKLCLELKQEVQRDTSWDYHA